MASACHVLSNESAQGAQELLSASIYGALYDFTNHRAEASSSGLPIPREAFLISARQHPNCIDKSLFESLNDRALILAVFWCLLNRVPDADTLAKWEGYAGKMPKQRFRRKLFRSLSYCIEARLKRVRCVSHAFDGIERISCFENSKLSENAVERFKLSVSFHIVDKLFMWLYTGWVFTLYKKTLMPIRIYFRERRSVHK